MAVVTIKHLLEAGVHFGHKTRRWNPKMKRFIFESRDGIYILDLQKTLEQLHAACSFIRQTVIKGKSILFVGTKKQARESIEKAGTETKMHFVNDRWLGGTLTNNATIRKSIRRLKYLDGLFENGTAAGLPKKEISSINRERARLHKNLDGIVEMDDLPGVVFIVDPKRERIATAEARKLAIPIVAIVDTNCDPDDVDFPIPANDDAIKSVSLIADIIAKVVQEALQERSKLTITIEDTEPEAAAEVPASKPAARAPRRRRTAKPGAAAGKTGRKTAKPRAAAEAEGAAAKPETQAAPPEPPSQVAAEKPKPEVAEDTQAEQPKANETPVPSTSSEESEPPAQEPEPDEQDADKPDNPSE